MKKVKAIIELEVPNSIAKRAEKAGLTIYMKDGKLCAKIDQYEVSPRKSTIEINITTRNGVNK